MLGNERWSPYGAPWLQPVATGRKCDRSENSSDRRNPLPLGCNPLRPGPHGKEGVDAETLSGDQSHREGGPR